MSRVLALAASLVLLAGCADYALTDAEERDAQLGGDNLESVLLRIDVHPPQEDYAAHLMPQTFDLDLDLAYSEAEDADGAYQEVLLRLARPVTVSGYVTGYQVSPWADADLPGGEQPVQARVSFRKRDSVQVVNTVTEDDGFYQVEVVPDFDYRASFVPDDPEIPFAIEALTLESERTLDITMGAGSAVWGQVLDGVGDPLSGARVYPVGPSGVEGSVATTDDQGRYLLRVPAGEVQLVCLGRNNGRDPTVGTEVLVVGEGGLRVDVVYPSLDAVTVGGRLLDYADAPVRDATIRLVAVELDGYPQDSALVMEIRPGSEGTFDTRLLAGTYTLEVLPDDGVDLTPLSLGEIEVDGDVDLGTLELASTAPLFGGVIDPTGQPVASAVIRVAEIGFGGREWSVHTDAEGDFFLLAPQVPLEFTLSPPGDRNHELSLTRHTVDPMATPDPVLSLAEGERLRGRVVDEDDVAMAYAVVEVRDGVDRLWAVTLTDSDGRFDVGVAWAP